MILTPKISKMKIHLYSKDHLITTVGLLQARPSIRLPSNTNRLSEVKPPQSLNLSQFPGLVLIPKNSNNYLPALIKGQTYDDTRKIEV